VIEKLSSSSARDWTLDKYEELCAAVLAAGYTVRRIDEYLLEPVRPCVLLRHDIDRIPGNALAMAELEAQLGIRATYYVRKVPSAYDDGLVSRLDSLGHEVGYHYEVLSKTKGNVDAALELFSSELAELRVHAPIRTASSHGSPLSPWDSLDIWHHASPSDFGLLGEAYLQIDYSDVAYYTDTGRSWFAEGTNLRDRVESKDLELETVRTTDELVAIVEAKRYPAICIQTHPERWNATAIGETRSLLFDWSANTAKRAIRALRPRHVR